jgi:phosphate transport system permease protein
MEDIRGSSDRGDRVFRAVVTLAAACIPLLLIGIFILLLLDALPAVQRFGPGFLTSSDWDPVAEKFGAAAYVYGTIVTSVVAVLLAGPIGVSCAVFIAEYAPRRLGEPVSFLIALLAAIPSIIYGLWGFFVLAPVMRGSVEPFLKNVFGGVPVVGGLFAGRRSDATCWWPE